MAYYAEIGSDNKVLNVLVVDDSWTHEQALMWLRDNVSNNLWLESRKDGSIRKRMACKNHTYDPIKDMFIPPKPFHSWTLNEDKACWEAPVPRPVRS